MRKAFRLVNYPPFKETVERICDEAYVLAGADFDQSRLYNGNTPERNGRFRMDETLVPWADHRKIDVVLQIE